eukprot:TRINITY_DN25085_c0_g1_i1.p1 TRINITY_DN25085_c0_g1~~TRINITY_DN25085_c0_g1_i1.p1  ORF type:complete len:144 (+),score=25.76 TRINITY_DN25085_c0_g1_i1:46-477(+)
MSQKHGGGCSLAVSGYKPPVNGIGWLPPSGWYEDRPKHVVMTPVDTAATVKEPAVNGYQLRQDKKVFPFHQSTRVQRTPEYTKESFDPHICWWCNKVVYRGAEELTLERHRFHLRCAELYYHENYRKPLPQHLYIDALNTLSV